MEEKKAPSPRHFSRAEMGKGISGMSHPDARHTFMWARDLANCAGSIMKNAAVLTYRLHEGDEEVEDLLDRITKRTATVWRTCCQGKPTITGLNDMLKDVRSTEKGRQVYAEFTHFVLISMFAFMFGGGTMSYRAPGMDELEDADRGFAEAVSLLGMLPYKLRRKLVREIGRKQYLPGYNMEGLERDTSEYLEEVETNMRQLARSNTEAEAHGS